MKDKLFGVDNVSYNEEYDMIVKAVDHETFKGLNFDYEVLRS